MFSRMLAGKSVGDCGTMAIYSIDSESAFFFQAVGEYKVLAASGNCEQNVPKAVGYFKKKY